MRSCASDVLQSVLAAVGQLEVMQGSQHGSGGPSQPSQQQVPQLAASFS